MRGWRGRALIAGWLLCASRAHAELGDDVRRLVEAWSRQGMVRRLAPRLVERGAPSVLFLPSELWTDNSDGCVSVAVLATTSTHFTLRAVGGSHWIDPEEAFPQASLAGLVQLTRCGARSSRLAVLLLEPRSPRAVIEVIAAKAQAPQTPALDVLPERDPGPVAPFTGLWPAFALPPIAERLATAEAMVRRNAASEVTRESLEPPSHGAGSVQRPVEPGCQRWQLLVEPNAEHPETLTLLPELSEGMALVSLEQGEGATATMTFCSALRGLAGFRFSGAPNNSRPWLLSTQSPLPAALPESWSAAGKAQMAALLTRRGGSPINSPLEQAQGLQGPTFIPLRVEPGTCYLAALSLLRGQASSMALAARVGGSTFQDHSAGGEGALLSFCVQRVPSMTIEADARGVGLNWLFALWRVGRIKTGEELAP